MTFVSRDAAVWLAVFLMWGQALHAAVVNATWNSATEVPVTASSFAATGDTVNFTLNFAPPTGTNLTVVNNTGLPFINGRFDNLAQGQPVSLAYNGIAYQFVVNYYGGTGNDLVLTWAGTRLFAWGYNTTYALGNGSALNARIPAAVTTQSTPLAGRPLLWISSGSGHSLALCADGTLLTWGDNTVGQLGNNSTEPGGLAGPVTVAGTPLAGKMAVAATTGHWHNLALCSDGTVVAWGQNFAGQLGNSTTTLSRVPVAVTTTGTALAGKTVVALGAGGTWSLALCSDGTLASWGSNTQGQLGNNSTTSSSVPVAVKTTGTALAGKSVVSIAAGASHSLALCSDGTVVSWGRNTIGQLGNGTTAESWVPVPVTVAGTALAGKTVVAVGAGEYHSLALCSDGTLAAWGNNGEGELGNNSTTNSSVPVAVSSGALAGKTVVSIKVGKMHNLALCSDGTLVAWGYNSYGQIGINSTTDSRVPVAVSTSQLGSGERVVQAVSGCYANHNLALVASPVPTVATLAATSVTATTVVLNGTVNANGGIPAVSFEYGLDTSYGTTVAGTPASAAGAGDMAVSAPLTGLASNTTYHFRIKGAGGSAIYSGTDFVFTTPNGNLSALALGTGTLSPAFSPTVYSYSAEVGTAVSSITLTPTTAGSSGTVTVNGVVVASGSASGTIPLSYGDNTIRIIIPAADNVSSVTYVIAVTRAVPAALAATYAASTDVPVTISSFTATGSTVDLALNHAPVTGTTLTVVNNTGLGFINGRFSNLAQGQMVALGYNGVTYQFVANYYGGTGNDLVLTWAGVRPFAWGYNLYGQLGNGNSTSSSIPAAMPTAGTPLAGRTVLAYATGGSHSLAACSDGTLLAFGWNGYGQLGNGTTSGANSVPVAVPTAGTALAGKTVIALSASYTFSLALCSDGTLAAWGQNTSGQLGNGTTTDSNVPVAVTTAGTVLAGKTVVAIGTGWNYCLVLCSDGSLAGWGDNSAGQFGNGSVIASKVPVPAATVGTTLAGKSVMSISVGSGHNLALCSDGTLVGWGANSAGQLGNNSTTNSTIPTAVAGAGTLLAGKTVIAVAAGQAHSVCLCLDGTLASWGHGVYSQLGNNSTANSSVPVAVVRSGVLAGKTVVSIGAGWAHSVARCSDGSVVTWGYGSNGQLGNNSTTDRSVPVLVSTTPLASGERLVQTTTGQQAYHTLALVASPVPTVTSLAATSVTTTTAVLNGTVNANGSLIPVFFEHGQSAAYGTTVAATPPTVSGTNPTAVSTTLTGLRSNTTYHFRVFGGSGAASHGGADISFTTLNANLSALALSAGALSPVFNPTVYSYRAEVGEGVSSIAVTPATSEGGTIIMVNGTGVVSGSTSSAIPLGFGDNTIKIVISAAGSGSSVTYLLVVRRAVPNPLPATFTASTDVPVTLSDFTAAGSTANLSLGHAPAPGTTLTVVNNTGAAFINGAFSNLAQGQVVNLDYNGATFPFVADYYGGTGNDLVLIWAGMRPVAWGSNDYGALGISGTGLRSTPTAVTVAGTPLAGRAVLRLVTGANYSLALCSDGTLVSWGLNDYGQLGNDSTTNSSIPVAVATAGTPLAGRRVIAICTGGSHSLALCSDGTLVGWGYNGNGHLGSGTTVTSKVPVAVTIAGTPLAGRTVVAIAASASQSLALCSDGTLATWGLNPVNGFARTAPVALPTAGTALEGKTIISLVGGGSHFLALCSDGTLVAWGANSYGQLGNGTTVDNYVPAVVPTAGTWLADRTITAVAAGANQSLALCSDGTVAVWGLITYGALGHGTTTQSSVPTAVGGFGPGYNRMAVAVTAGSYHSVAQCSDDTLVAWGRNDYGQLGIGSTSGPSAPFGVYAPTGVSVSPLAAGERYAMAASGALSAHTLALVAMPLAPTAITAAASPVGTTTVVLNGTMDANGGVATAAFEYGLDSSYGQTVAAMPAAVSGGSPTGVSITLNGLLPNTTYHFRLRGSNAAGTTNGADMTFTTRDATLASLAPGAGTLTPAFSPMVFSYHADVGPDVSSIVFTPTLSDSAASVALNGAATASGSASSIVPLGYGDNTVKLVVTAAGSSDTVTYTVVVSRALPAACTVVYNTGNEVPVTTSGFTAASGSISFALNYAPLPGATLTVLNNTGISFINGRFSNLAQGQYLTLRHNGVDYPFIANYYGGTGNDLVLSWAYSRPVAWGWGQFGQLGTGSTDSTTEFVPVTTADTSLAQRAVLALATGGFHSLALCSDGTLHAWGFGDGWFGDIKLPVPVTTAGTALDGKTVVAIAAGERSSLALCSDGTMAAWGMTGGVPYAVPTAGTALEGKTVVSIAAGAYHNLALCSDGTLVAWGPNYYGQLGNGSITPNGSLPPVAVVTAGTPLAGRQVVSIAAGAYHNLALCSDGTLVAWGQNDFGQVGIDPGGSSYITTPVAVRTAGTALEGKTVTAVAAGYYYSMALCSDGTLAAWGRNEGDALGVTPPAGLTSNYPSVVNSVGALAGKTVVGLTGGAYTLQARCSDGSTVYWGAPGVPPEEVTSFLAPGERLMSVFTGSSASHTLGLAAAPLPAATTLAAAPVGTTTAVLKGTVNANDTPVPATVFFEYGLDASYGRTLAATPAGATGSSTMAVSAAVAGLQSNTTYHYRVKVVGGSVEALGADQTFTTLNGNLSGLVPGVGALTPAFSPATYSYRMDVGMEVSSITLTPAVSDSQATVTINGVAAASGSPSAAIPLTHWGENVVNIVVTASDHLSTLTYTLVVVRPVPSEWTAAFASATDVPLTTSAFTATGGTVSFALSYAPTPGTVLTVVKNTGQGFINGRLSNLEHGQRVNLTYNGMAYAFVTSYHGGTGNDLVLIWAGTRLTGWTYNGTGQLTNNSSNILAGTPLSSRTPVALAAGNAHSLALFADGSMAAWGANDSGQLGNGSTGGASYTPAIVSTAGTVLAGKVVVAVSAGGRHNLALCADGTLAAWGDNYYGQLGNGTTTSSSVPVAVTTAGTPLEGKSVVAICAGVSHSLALCSDGTVMAWGSNDTALLGNWDVWPISLKPVAVMTAETALAGKSVVAIAAGANHNLALCSDGSLVTWGANWQGQLGIGTLSNISAYQAMAVATQETVLEGKTITAIAAGGSHNLVLCSDGTIAAWGYGNTGSLGNSTYTTSGLPVAVDRSGVLTGKTVMGITAGGNHSAAWCADGTVAAWGSNYQYGQLGNYEAGNSSSIPVRATTLARGMGETFKRLASGPNALHTLGLVATAPPDGSPPSSDATLSGLTFSSGAPDTPFASDSTSYFVIFDSTAPAYFTVTPTARENHAVITVNNESVASGTASAALPVGTGGYSSVAIGVTAPDGYSRKAYYLTVVRFNPAQQWAYQVNVWRNQQGFYIDWGTMTNTADYDFDGISNLMEYALNLDPKAPGKLPAATAMNAGNFEYTYTRSTAAANAGTVFSVQWSASLSAGSWSAAGVTETVLSDDGTTQQVKAVIPKGAATSLFVRLSVSGPP